MRPGEIHLASFPFGDAPGMKLRPVLLLTGRIGIGTEVLVAYISSIIPDTPLATDILLDPLQPEHASTRLKATSMLRLHKLATIHTSSLQRYIGKLSPATRQQARDIIQDLVEL